MLIFDMNSTTLWGNSTTKYLNNKSSFHLQVTNLWNQLVIQIALIIMIMSIHLIRKLHLREIIIKILFKSSIHLTIENHLKTTCKTKSTKKTSHQLYKNLNSTFRTPIKLHQVWKTCPCHIQARIPKVICKVNWILISSMPTITQNLHQDHLLMHMTSLLLKDRMKNRKIWTWIRIWVVRSTWDLNRTMRRKKRINRLIHQLWFK